MYQAESYVAGHGGIELEKNYPYIGLWSKGKCKFDAKKAVGKFSGYTNVSYANEAALKVAAYEQPVVSVGIDASSGLFMLYRFGVYDDKSCSNATSTIDHGVAVVGYGTERGKDYWIVRNSWGVLWGDVGYIKMARNKDNQCGVASTASFARI